MTPALVSGATALLAVSLTAALWTVTLIGRTSLEGLSLRWAGTFLLVAGALLGWTLLSRRPALTATGLVPSAVASAAVLVVLYASDNAYHAYVYGPWWRGAALPAPTKDGLTTLGANSDPSGEKTTGSFQP